MVKVLFAFWPLYVKYNHGIALLSALCKEKNIETELYILDDLDNFISHLINNQYDYIGFSCVTEHDYKKCLPFMHAAKATGIRVIAGGVYLRRAIAPECPADLICRGDGEALPDFLIHGHDLMFRAKVTCQDINSLPLPDYELFKDIPFDRGIPFLEGKKVLPYHSSRGCPYQCPFCEVSGQPKTVRVRYKVKDDLQYLMSEYNPDLFFICDELLPYYDSKWRDSWGDLFVPFIAYIRADIPGSILQWLKEHGMIGCMFGVEAGDEWYRNEVLGKSLTDEHIYQTVRVLKDLDIHYATFFMTGTIGESFSLKAKTYKMAEELGGVPFIFKYENLFAVR